jgi:hypothetical protein
MTQEGTRTASGYSLGRRVMRCVKWKRDEITGRTVADGEQDVYYDTFIDLHELDRLARKASRNANWKSKDGAIRVHVAAVQPVGEKEEPHK